MISLNIPAKCAAPREADANNDIGDNIRVLACANLLAVDLSLKSAQRTAAYLELDIPFWSWDEAVEKFAEKGRKVEA